MLTLKSTNTTALNINFPQTNPFSFLALLLVLAIAAPKTLLAQGYIASSTYLGGNSNENSPIMAVDNGETYILGYVNTSTNSSTYPITTGSAFAGGYSDMVVTKLDANGTIVWSRFLGGNSWDLPTGIKVVNGAVFLSGNSYSSNYPVTDGSTLANSTTAYSVAGVYTKLNAATGAIEFSTYIASTNGTADGIEVVNNEVYVAGSLRIAGNADIRITKYSATTNAILFTQTYGGSSSEYVQGYRAGSKFFQIVGNSIYLAAWTSSANFPVTNGSTMSEWDDPIYMKVNATTGALTFATYYGGSGWWSNNATDLRVDNGKVYIYGQTVDTDLPTTDGSIYKGDINNLVDDDTYIICFDGATNNILFYKYLGGDIYDIGGSMEVQNGTVYLAGYSQSSNYPITVGALSPSIFGGDAFFTKLDGTTGAILYSSFLTATNNDDGATFMKVVNGDAYLLGVTSSSNFPVTNGSTLSTVNDIFFTKISSNNSICFSSYLGGSIYDEAMMLEVMNEDVYIGGISQSNNYPVTNGSSLQTSGSNVSDFVLTRFNLNPTAIVANDNPTPATQTVCRYGIAQKLIDDQTTFTAAGVPTIYRNGVASTQSPFALKYQWQKAPSTAGPWTNIPNGIKANYTPNVGATNQYYRRITNSAACGGIPTVLSTSSVVAVLVNSNTAPSVNVGNVVNTCSGNTVAIGGAPTATANGGATISSYLWTPAGTYTPNNTVANPTVTPTANTIFNVLVTDNNGCQNIGQQLVNVYTANAGADASTCAGQNVRIGGKPIAGLSGVVYAWTASPADPTMSCTGCAQPIVHPSITTTYTLSLTIPVTGGGTCTTTDDVIVTPVAAPITPNFAGSDQTICIGNIASLGTAAEAGFTYTWAPGNYLTGNNTALTYFQPGSLAMPVPNPFKYYLTASKLGCSFVDSVKAIVIEAKAGVDGCGPRNVGVGDRTPNVNEVYTWTKISGPGSFLGATNLPVVPVSTSVGGATTYQLEVSFNGITCSDLVVVPVCGCVVDIAVSAPFSCPSFGLNGGNVQLVATAADIFSSDPNLFSYSWAGAAGISTTTGRIVTLTDNVSRTYTVTMSSPFDTSFHCTRDILVNNPAWSLPVFTAQDVTVCPATPVNIGQAPVAGYAYFWTNPTKLNSATISNPSATVNTTTDFTVKVTDTGSGCTATDIATVTVAGFPPNIAGADAKLCGAGAVQLGLAAVTDVSYIWTPATTYTPNNTTANPTVTVATTTTFHVVATNAVTGCVTNDDVTITVGAAVAPFTFVNQTFCPSVAGAMTLPAGPAGMTSYSWSPATQVLNATSNGPTATTLDPRPADETSYTLSVLNADGCGASASVDFTPSVLSPDAGDSRAICKDATAELGGSNLGGVYNWTCVPASGASELSSTNSSNPVFTPTTTGTYVFTVSRTDAGGCITTANVTVTVIDFIVPAIASPTVCENTCVPIGTPFISGAQYIWTPSTGLSDATISNPVACVTSATITYTLTAIGVNGCIATQNVIVGVNATPSPIVTIPTITACLIDGSATINPSVSPASTYNYTWSPNDATLNDIYSSNPTALFTAVGTKIYTVTVTNATTGCSNTAAATLNIGACPPPPQGSVGNYVWLDINSDGLNNETSSAGINSITVELWKETAPNNGIFTQIETTNTANDASGNPGYYNFIITESANYKIKFPTANNTQTLTTATTTASTDNNSDANTSTGFSPIFAIDVSSVGTAKDNMTIDAAYICPSGCINIVVTKH